MFLEEDVFHPKYMALPVAGTAFQPSSCWIVDNYVHRLDFDGVADRLSFAFDEERETAGEGGG